VIKLAADTVSGNFAVITEFLTKLEHVEQSSTQFDNLDEALRQLGLFSPQMVEFACCDTPYSGTLPTEIGLLKVLQKLDTSLNPGLVGTSYRTR
jgi:hypothetical protein